MQTKNCCSNPEELASHNCNTNMATILCMETGSTTCSVALGSESGVIGFREVSDANIHASALPVLIEELIRETGFELGNIDAIAVSMGPGSYTGLRIGVSLAKGMCYALHKPLIAVGSLEAMVTGVGEFINMESINNNSLLSPMIDARRMEVYTQLFNRKGEMLSEVKALVVETDTFSDLLKKNTVVFFGSGASKCQQVIGNSGAIFVEHFKPSARYLLPLAQKKFRDELFEDIAYFEPYYLKDFVPTRPKNRIIPD